MLGGERSAQFQEVWLVLEGFLELVGQELGFFRGGVHEELRETDAWRIAEHGACLAFGEREGAGAFGRKPGEPAVGVAVVHLEGEAAFGFGDTAGEQAVGATEALRTADVFGCASKQVRFGDEDGHVFWERRVERERRAIAPRAGRIFLFIPFLFEQVEAGRTARKVEPAAGRTLLGKDLRDPADVAPAFELLTTESGPAAFTGDHVSARPALAAGAKAADRMDHDELFAFLGIGLVDRVKADSWHGASALDVAHAELWMERDERRRTVHVNRRGASDDEQGNLFSLLEPGNDKARIETRR